MQPDRVEQQSFEPIQRANGPRARVAPRVKLLLALAALVAINIAQPWWLPVAPGVPLSWGHLLLAVGLIAVLVKSRIAWRYLLVRLAGFALPLALIALSIPLTRGAAGWPIMAGVLTKGLLSFTIVLVLVRTTGFDRLLAAMRQCGVPKLLVAVLAATYRYLFVLLDELERMRRAQYARTFYCRHRFSAATVRNGTRLIGMSVVRASERAERVHAAMLARGYDGEARFLEESS